MKWESSGEFGNYILLMIEEDNVDIVKQNAQLNAKREASGEAKRKDLIFYSISKPKLCVLKFISYLLEYNIVPVDDIEICKIYFLGLLHRLCNTTKFKLTNLNCHMTILTLLMITAKFLEDEYLCNRYWAISVGIKLSEINNMEAILLELLDYNIFISKEQLLHINKSIGLNKKHDTLVSININ